MKHIDTDTLIKGLKDFRISKGYTLQDIGDYCGYTPQYIFKFEAGKANSMDLLLKYIQLGFRVEDYIKEI